MSQAGDFIIEELTLVTSNNLAVDLTASVIGLTLYESIVDMTVTGTIAIQDSVNLASYGPIIGQEYLHLKIKTPLFTDGNTIIDFKDNAFFVHTISKRQQISNGVQGFVLSFTSSELVKNQRLKVTKKLEGTWSDIVEDMLLKEIKTGKKVIIESTAGIKKFIAPNMRPLDVVVMAAKQAIARYKGEPTFIFYESLKGFNFRTLASLYNEPARIEYTPYIAGTTVNKATVNKSVYDVEKDLSTIIDYEIVNNSDTIANYRTGMYGSKLIVHDILNKNYISQEYNYHDNFSDEAHIQSGTTAKRPEFPVVSDIAVQSEDGGRRVSDYPARTFLLPTSLVSGSDSQHQAPNGTSVYVGYDPERWVQRRHSQMLQLENALNINILVYGNTAINVGDIVDVNIPYTAAIKSDGNPNDEFYSGPFLIKRIRHEFDMTSSPRKHQMYISLVKDSLPKRLGAGGPPEPSSPTKTPLDYNYGITLDANRAI
jgi:hypothetical protein